MQQWIGIAAWAMFTPGFIFAQDSIGGSLFRDNCAECHQPNGQGIANIYPALAGNKLVASSAVDMALVILIGRGEMPSFARVLSNNEIAEIINYVRNAWGNAGEPINEETVESLL